MVQRVDLSTEEEILVLLHFAGERGMIKREIGSHAMRSLSSVATFIQKLEGADYLQIVMVE